MNSLTTKMSRTPYRTTALAAVALSSLTMSACAFKTDGPPPDPQISKLQQQLDENRPLTLQDFKYGFRSGKDLNSYSAIISWPAGRSLQIKLSKNSKVIQTADGRIKNSFEISCEAGRVDVTLEVISPTTGTLSQPSLNFPCPTDLEVKQSTSNIKLLQSVDGHLILRHGVVISVAESGMSLNLRELTIDGSAKVQVFNNKNSPRKTTADVKANRPPVISIHAPVARGNLELELNGVDGAPVAPIGEERDVALSGAQGTHGTFKTEARERKSKSEIGSGVTFEVHSCDTQPGRGEDGKQPLDRLADGTFVPRKGRPGRDGVPGIGTPKLDLQIGDASQLTTLVLFNPGLASKPGSGGLPKGGIGGPPGANPGAGCLNASTGSDGPDGIQGDSGRDADNGRCEVVYTTESVRRNLSMKDLNPVLECSHLPAILQIGQLPPQN